MVKCKTNRINFLMMLFSLCTCMLSCSTEGPGKRDSLTANEKKYYAGKGVGPVSELNLDPVDSSLAASGKIIFDLKCFSCHRVTDQKVIGPGLLGVTTRRTPEWIMNQMLNPLGMTESDSMAKELKSIYLTQMVPMGLTMEEARSVLEYLRINL